MELKNILNKEQYEAATHGEGPLSIRGYRVYMT